MPETARLSLRPLQKEDAPALYRLTADPEVARYMRFSTHTKPEQAAELIAEYTAPGCCAFAVFPKESGRFGGVFAFKPGEQPEAYTLSIILSPSLWNKGYATELLTAMISHAESHLHGQTLTAYVVESNSGSRRVLEKCRFAVASVRTFPDFDDRLLVYVLSLKKNDSAAKETSPHV